MKALGRTGSTSIATEKPAEKKLRNVSRKWGPTLFVVNENNKALTEGKSPCLSHLNFRLALENDHQRPRPRQRGGGTAGYLCKGGRGGGGDQLRVMTP